VGVMPKEITYGDSPTFLAMPDGNEISERDVDPANPPEGGKWRRRGVHVGWVRDRQVEVGIAAFDPAKEQPNDGIFLTLDRNGLNRLIRSLQKAGRSAFGTDAW
jgi:hypothetical protein